MKSIQKISIWGNTKGNTCVSFKLFLKINDCLIQTLKHYEDSVVRQCGSDLSFINLINEAEDRN